MLLRKRAWDVFREDFPKVKLPATLTEVINTLRASMKEEPEIHFAVVVNDRGNFKGVVSMWNVLAAVEEYLLGDDELSQQLADEPTWDKAFVRASAICVQQDITAHIDEEPTIFKPTDPLLIVLESMLRERRHYGLVVEGGKCLGVVLMADLFRELSRDMAQTP